MKPIRCLWMLLLPLFVAAQPAAAQPATTQPTTTQPAAAPLRPAAGETVAEADVERLGADAFFTVETIDEALRRRIVGRSYREGCPVPLAELRYLRVLHRDFEGRTRRGELLCHRDIADDLAAIFRALYLAGYPIAQMRLVDDFDADDVRSMEADNTSAFNYRPIAGSKTLSRHSLGRAIDINPLRNPCVRLRDGRTLVEPEAGRPYADRTRDFPGRFHEEDLCVRLFKARGFRWGGDWRSLKDYQHFEK